VKAGSGHTGNISTTGFCSFSNNPVTLIRRGYVGCVVYSHREGEELGLVAHYKDWPSSEVSLPTIGANILATFLQLPFNSRTENPAWRAWENDSR